MIPDASHKLIQSLQDPAVLGGRAGPVEVCQTHMSWVLLAGPHAYKIKKPVEFGFGDFSTLEKRLHSCREELRINRRLAAELYLDLVPITGSPESPQLAGDGPAIEYAVKMKRFPQHSLLGQVLERGELTAEHIDRLVEQIADFHGRIEVDADPGGFGTPEAIRRPMQANFDGLRQRTDNQQLARRLADLRDWSEREFNRRQPVFARRKADGLVRECHGDMHLGNIILWNDALFIFDAIEFNENLRWIDVLSETAFLAMDLEDRGRADFARRALNHYLEITGDYTGTPVLRHYLAYRALVRAKVSNIQLNQKGAGDQQQRQQLRDALLGYVALAERYASPPHPKVTITHGLSGSGKTTGSARLVETAWALRLRSDVERKRLFGLSSGARSGSEVNRDLYSSEATRQCYARLDELAETIVQAGYSVVVDAAFLKQWQRNLLRETAARLKVPFCILDFQADETTLRDRVARREAQGHDASEASLGVLEAQLESAEPLSEGERHDSIRINTQEPNWVERMERIA